MYKILRNIGFAALFIQAFISLAATQERTLISGLESDSVYKALVTEEQGLKLREDSLNTKVAETRNLFRSDPENREVYSQDIIRLEGEIFDVRNRIGIIAGRINTIEQEYIIRNLSGGNDPRQDSGQGEVQDQFPEISAVIVLNPFFEQNLTPEDYRTLAEAQRKEADVLEKINTFSENYTTIRNIALENEDADTPETADSLYSAYETLTGLNARLSELIDEEFGHVYDNKLYCYNYILDKLGRRDQLSALEKKVADTRDKALAVADGAASPVVAAYPYRKALLLEYEEALARIAGYGRSEDSLRKAAANLKTMNFDFPSIMVEEKLFLDYSEIEFHNPAKYNSRNPVPELTVHPKGEIFRILLGSFQRAQPVSILRGTYPVGVLHEDGRFSYYAGGFETVEQAGSAVDELRAKGFKDPKVARWTNGQYTLFGQDELDRMLGKTTAGVFRLSVDTGGKPLPDIVKEIIEDLNPGAEISRSGELYIIGIFGSRTEAEEVADEIEDTLDWVEVTVENVN